MNDPISVRNIMSISGKAGDVMFFPGLLQHCAMPNRAAEGSRTGVLIQMLPKFVRPMEDLKSSIAPEVVRGLPKVCFKSQQVPFSSFINVSRQLNCRM